MLKDYYLLTKPGIIYGNSIAALAGFFLASTYTIDIVHGGIMLLGLVLIIASGCVFNNYIDRSIDKKMARTKIRALPAGRISPINALLYASVLGIMGTFLLGWYINVLTMGIALFGLFSYVVLYGIAKRRSVWGTVVGSIAGAVPPVVGYCAVTGQIDTAAILLFLILVFWQMPHFYTIAIYRMNDYKAALIPVLPIVSGVYITKWYTLVYVVAFLIASMGLTIFGYTGIVYTGITASVGIIWLWIAIQGFSSANDIQWARKLFKFSLVVLLAWCLALSFTVVLP